MYCQVLGYTCVWDQCIRADVCMPHRGNLRDAGDSGGGEGTVYAQTGEDLLATSHVTSTVGAQMGGRVGGRTWGRAAFGRLIRIPREARIE